MQRVTEFPAGVSAPKKARVYARQTHFIVQWWDPAAKGNLSERVDGDLIDAIVVAREVDRRLEDYRSSGRVRTRLSHSEVVDKFLADMRHRADAGEVTPATVNRYASALAHYQEFAETPEVRRAYPHAHRVDREFSLRFSAFLNTRSVAPNGHARATKAPMRSTGFALDTVRALFEWAADPQRGRCLPAGFVNPFRKGSLNRRQPAADLMAEPDITTGMATDFLHACDDWQLALFAPMLLYGLRASEPAWLFREHVRDGLVVVPCIPDLAYTTKGLRDKRLPLLDEIVALWGTDKPDGRKGLVYTRRSVHEGRESPALLGRGLQELIGEFQGRCRRNEATSAQDRQRIRDAVLYDAGALTYDRIHDEFRRVADKLRWPAAATLKDFRHLFSTCLANGGMPEHERRYLMGHAPGRDAITTYTHMNRIREHYAAIVESEWSGAMAILRSRLGGTYLRLAPAMDPPARRSRAG